MALIHLDLFSGIGGFALAADEVFGDVEHIFCDNDKFCQKVLNKHWPEAKIYDDIRAITNTEDTHWRSRQLSQNQTAVRPQRIDKSSRSGTVDLLTGGFPCQPFSAAGLRKGTADDRHLWPEMLRVIRLTKPQWVIAENVRGLLTWDDGLVFEQVCTDLEAEGYEVQPFIIPAVAVNAPHRRDRIWFVANRRHDERGRRHGRRGVDEEYDSPPGAHQDSRQRGPGQAGVGPQHEPGYEVGDDTDPQHKGLQGSERAGTSSQRKRTSRSAAQRAGDDTHPERQRPLQRTTQNAEGHGQFVNRSGSDKGPDWSQNWLEVATSLCGVDDGLPAGLDGFELTKAGHRVQRLKSLGNAIVPQVAMEIMRGMGI